MLPGEKSLIMKNVENVNYDEIITRVIQRNSKSKENKLMAARIKEKSKVRNLNLNKNSSIEESKIHTTEKK